MRTAPICIATGCPTAAAPRTSERPYALSAAPGHARDTGPSFRIGRMNFRRRSLIERDAASRHSGVDRVARSADRGRPDVGRSLSALAAGARAGVRRVGAAGAADFVGLPAVLRHRPDRFWTDLRPCRPQAGAARRAVALRRRLLELYVRNLDRNADRLALPAGPGRCWGTGAGARHCP